MVPFGPRLVLRTSCKPLAALIFTASAWAALATSALGFNALIADIFDFARAWTIAAPPRSKAQHKLRAIEGSINTYKRL